MKDYYVMEYMYRDANNFKAFGEILLSGIISDNDIAEIKSLLDSGEFFVAEQLRVPVLYSQLWKYSNGPTVADHASHEFFGFRPATVKEISTMKLWGNVSTLIERFRCIDTHWDCTQSVHCLSV